MTSQAIERILSQIAGVAAFKVNTTKESYTFITERDRWEVTHEENVLFLKIHSSYYWIDCKCVTSIEYSIA